MSRQGECTRQGLPALTGLEAAQAAGARTGQAPAPEPRPRRPPLKPLPERPPLNPLPARPPASAASPPLPCRFGDPPACTAPLDERLALRLAPWLLANPEGFAINPGPTPAPGA